MAMFISKHLDLHMSEKRKREGGEGGGWGEGGKVRVEKVEKERR